MHTATASHFTPTLKAALLAALSTPSHTLTRASGGFTPVEPIVVQPFTRRAINMLERQGLVKFDNPDFPSAATLTGAGLQAARQIKAEQSTGSMQA